MRLEPVDHDPFLEPVDHDPFVRKFYLIRHGATALNSESGGPDRIRGWSDIPLSKEGEEEAKKLGQELKSSGLGMLYYSTLIRARETAQAIAATTQAILIPEPDLRPWNLGEFTGKESKAVHPQMMDFAMHKPDEPIPGGGESFNHFKFRVMACVKKLLETTPSDILFGIVTHHRVERLLKAWVAGGERPDLEIDFGAMFKHGESTGHAETIEIDPQKLGA